MIRFLSFSFLFHALLLGAIYFLLKPAQEEAASPRLQLSEGEVFVGKSPLDTVPIQPDPVPPQAEALPAPSIPADSSAPAAEESTASESSAPPETSGIPNSDIGAETRGAPEGEARLKEGVTIAYPPLSVRTGEEGSVTIALEISEEGIATYGNIKRSSGFPRLDQAALQALNGARYQPAMRNNLAAASHKEITVNFQLSKAGAPAAEILP